ncbi:hypothetical protein IGI04_021540, partial [Brassica rapa subsp. trilocularis]
DLHVSRRHSSQSDRQVLYSPRLPPPVRANSKGDETFHQRVDRHGRYFGDRVTSEISLVRPLKNKITPDNSSGSPPKEEVREGKTEATSSSAATVESTRETKHTTYPASSSTHTRVSGSSSGLAVGSKTSSTTGAKRRGRPPGAKKTRINSMSMGGSAKKMIFSKNTNCIHCGQTETTEHLLLHCPYAAQVWSLIPKAGSFDPGLCLSVSEAAQTSRTWTCLPPSGISSDIFSWVCWNLWTARNKLLFESRPTCAQATATKSLVNAREWLQAQDLANSPQKNTQIQARPPSIPLGTLNAQRKTKRRQAKIKDIHHQ